MTVVFLDYTPHTVVEVFHKLKIGLSLEDTHFTFSVCEFPLLLFISAVVWCWCSALLSFVSPSLETILFSSPLYLPTCPQLIRIVLI
jgi:hypothetical protein